METPNYELKIVVNGQELQEYEHEGKYYVVATAGQKFSVRMVIPTTPEGAGVVLLVDDILAYGHDSNLGLGCLMGNGSGYSPRGMNQESDDRSENEIPGPLVGNSIEGNFMFKKIMGDETENYGTVRVEFYENAHRKVVKAQTRGCDMRTEVVPGTGSIDFATDFVYEPGPLMLTREIRYGSEAYLKHLGII
ncbi:MAG: hypothetical protein SFV17_19045 [Candidatus Obscuribacter sp.]|nr:hypothetical protein [Candidatus Obscuribacter sp.]